MQGMDELDTASLVKLSVEAIEKEKKDLAEKIRVVSKRMDHIERASRQEERPMLEVDYKAQQARDRRAFESLHENRVKALRERHAADLAVKKRLSSVLPEYYAFRSEKEKMAIANNAKATEESRQKIEAEINKRRAAIRSERAEARRVAQEEEAARAAQEAEERRLQEGVLRLRCLHCIGSLMHLQRRTCCCGDCCTRTRRG